MDLAAVRRAKTLEVMRENALEIIDLALCLGKTEEQMVRLLEQKSGSISDSFARQIEQTFSKPMGWLDQDGDGSGINYDLFG